MTPIAGFAATVHDGVKDDAIVLGLPEIVDDEREPTEDIAPNLRGFHDASAIRGGNDRGNCALDSHDKSVCN